MKCAESLIMKQKLSDSKVEQLVNRMVKVSVSKSVLLSDYVAKVIKRIEFNAKKLEEKIVIVYYSVLLQQNIDDKIADSILQFTSVSIELQYKIARENYSPRVIVLR